MTFAAIVAWKPQFRQKVVAIYGWYGCLCAKSLAVGMSTSRWHWWTAAETPEIAERSTGMAPKVQALEFGVRSVAEIGAISLGLESPSWRFRPNFVITVSLTPANRFQILHVVIIKLTEWQRH
jgi:hypothetical protein